MTAAAGTSHRTTSAGAALRGREPSANKRGRGGAALESGTSLDGQPASSKAARRLALRAAKRRWRTDARCWASCALIVLRFRDARYTRRRNEWDARENRCKRSDFLVLLPGWIALAFH